MSTNTLQEKELNGSYKVRFNEIKDGEYNIDVDDASSFLKGTFMNLIIVVIIAVLLMLVYKSRDSELEAQKVQSNLKEIQALQQSHTSLQIKVDNLIHQNKIYQEQLASNAQDKSNSQYYAIKKVNVSKTKLAIPEALKVEQKTPAVPAIPEVPAL